jgi:hypothetical protein
MQKKMTPHPTPFILAGYSVWIINTDGPIFKSNGFAIPTIASTAIFAINIHKQCCSCCIIMFIIKKEEEKLVGDDDNPPSQWRSVENNSNEDIKLIHYFYIIIIICISRRTKKYTSIWPCRGMCQNNPSTI